MLEDDKLLKIIRKLGITIELLKISIPCGLLWNFVNILSF